VYGGQHLAPGLVFELRFLSSLIDTFCSTQVSTLAFSSSLVGSSILLLSPLFPWNPTFGAIALPLFVDSANEHASQEGLISWGTADTPGSDVQDTCPAFERNQRSRVKQRTFGNAMHRGRWADRTKATSQSHRIKECFHMLISALRGNRPYYPGETSSKQASNAAWTVSGC
jgi:hypothetical protein